MMSKMAITKVTTTELIQSTRREIMQFLHKHTTGDACACELFRRAIALRDEQAWIGIYKLYHVVVGSWILRQVPTLLGTDLAVLVNEVFAKFSRSISPRKLRNFPGVQALLAYLKRCVGSVVADYRRSCLTRAQEEPLESVTQEPLRDNFAEVVADQLAAQEIWRITRSKQLQFEQLLIHHPNGDPENSNAGMLAVCWACHKRLHRKPGHGRKKASARKQGYEVIRVRHLMEVLARVGLATWATTNGRIGWQIGTLDSSANDHVDALLMALHWLDAEVRDLQESLIRTQRENVRLTDRIIRTRQAEERRHLNAAIRETVCR